MVAARSFRKERKSGLWIPNRKPPLQSRINWQHPIVRDRSLVAAYLMNEGGGNQIFDIAGGHTGAFVNAPTWVAGTDGPAIDFDGGDDHIACGANADFQGMAELSLFAWIRASEDMSGTLYRTIIDRYSAGFMLTFDNGVLRAFIDTTVSSYNFSSTAGAITDQNNHFVAMIYGGSTGKLYIDNVLVKTQAGMSGNIVDTLHDLYLGAYNGASEHFKGLIDKILIFNRALLASEVAQLYRKPYYFIETLGPHHGAMTAFNNPWWYYQRNKMRRAA